MFNFGAFFSNDTYILFNNIEQKLLSFFGQSFILYQGALTKGATRSKLFERYILNYLHFVYNLADEMLILTIWMWSHRNLIHILRNTGLKGSELVDFNILKTTNILNSIIEQSYSEQSYKHDAPFILFLYGPFKDLRFVP